MDIVYTLRKCIIIYFVFWTEPGSVLSKNLLRSHHVVSTGALKQTVSTLDFYSRILFWCLNFLYVWVFCLCEHISCLRSSQRWLWAAMWGLDANLDPFKQLVLLITEPTLCLWLYSFIAKFVNGNKCISHAIKLNHLKNKLLLCRGEVSYSLPLSKSFKWPRPEK